MYTIKIPSGSEITHFHAPGGRIYQPTIRDGELVLDILEHDLRCLLRSGPLGQRISQHNPDVIRMLATQDMANNQAGMR
jgi:hypothetical protein